MDTYFRLAELEQLAMERGRESEGVSKWESEWRLRTILCRIRANHPISPQWYSHVLPSIWRSLAPLSRLLALHLAMNQLPWLPQKLPSSLQLLDLSRLETGRS